MCTKPRKQTELTILLHQNIGNPPTSQITVQQHPQSQFQQNCRPLWASLCSTTKFVIPRIKSDESLQVDYMNFKRTIQDLVDWPQLAFNEFNDSILELLTTIHPRLTSLSICLGPSVQFETCEESIEKLIKFWSSTLQVFKLRTRPRMNRLFRKPPKPISFSHLFRTLSRCNQLKVLHLEVSQLEINELRLHLPLTSKLEELYIDVHNFELSEQLFRNLSSINNMKHIGFGSVSIMAEQFTSESISDNTKDKFLSKVEHLSFNENFILSATTLNMLCINLTNLTSLELAMSDTITFAELANCLINLPQLIHLRLLRFLSAQSTTMSLLRDSETIEPVNQLISVKILTIDIHNLPNHKMMNKLATYLSSFLPELRIIRINHCRSLVICDKCHRNRRQMETFNKLFRGFLGFTGNYTRNSILLECRCLQKQRDPFLYNNKDTKEKSFQWLQRISIHRFCIPRFSSSINRARLKEVEEMKTNKFNKKRNFFIRRRKNQTSKSSNDFDLSNQAYGGERSQLIKRLSSVVSTTPLLGWTGNRKR
ncbi:hypothetical protein RDWZM_005250 [Blomia tropicalis]|uniref:Uncharacterized protein n=1 Tax=Blomia tropicalis TaxID=40697 RepID=A0A9Q0M3M8_BLOTA|nr:hypothetical protein RDWZM_005250 [Blomia tropicalis]